MNKILVIVSACVLLAACASPNPLAGSNYIAGQTPPAGFWWGLWNGITIWFSFIGKLFGANVALYEVRNNGGWYDFGFILGLISPIYGSHWTK